MILPPFRFQWIPPEADALVTIKASANRKNHGGNGWLAIEAAGVLAVFALFFAMCQGQMPEEFEDLPFWAAVKALCLTGVFWLGWHMLRVTLRSPPIAAEGH